MPTLCYLFMRALPPPAGAAALDPNRAGDVMRWREALEATIRGSDGPKVRRASGASSGDNIP